MVFSLYRDAEQAGKSLIPGASAVRITHPSRLPAVVPPDRVGRAAHGAGVPVTVCDDGLIPSGGITPGG